MKNMFIVLALLLSVRAMSQNNANNKLMSWFNISEEYLFSERTRINSLYSLRRANFIENWIYSGILHKLNNRTALKLGYINQYILKSNNNQTENNLILQFGINFKF